MDVEKMISMIENHNTKKISEEEKAKQLLNDFVTKVQFEYEKAHAKAEEEYNNDMESDATYKWQDIEMLYWSMLHGINRMHLDKHITVPHENV